MVGKRRAPGRGPGVGFRIVRRRHCVVSFRAGDIGIEIFQPEGKLIGVEALGAASEPGSLGAPGSVNLEVRVVPLAPARLQALHHLRHVLCPVLGRNQDRILRRDDQEVLHSDGGK